MKVLLVECDEKISKEISYYLRIRFPEAVIIPVDRGSGCLEMIMSELPDLVILDSALPDVDHRELVPQIRKTSDVPLLVLTKAEADADRAQILEMGADDYVIMPYSPIELLARIKALLRRLHALDFSEGRLFFINRVLAINFSTREVFLSNRKIRLTPIEYKLLSELARNNGHVLTHRLILEKVWGKEYTGDHSYVKKYIYRLRSKLDTSGLQPFLVSERGIGYKLIKQL